MSRRRRVLALGGGLLVVAVVAAAALWASLGGADAGADRLLAPLPAGYRYATMEEDDAEATVELFRDGYGASDVAVALVGAPEDLAPLGVTVVAFVFPDPPPPRELARQLERDVTLVDPKPKSLAGQAVLSHEGDATFSSVTLWVHGRLALLAYGATTAEVDGVLERLLVAGAWRDHPAA